MVQFKSILLTEPNQQLNNTANTRRSQRSNTYINTHTHAHAPDGQPLGHIHTQVVSAWQGRHKLQVEGTEAAHDALGAPHEDVVLAGHQTVGTRGLRAARQE